jgi:hypothetical protein
MASKEGNRTGMAEKIFNNASGERASTQERSRYDEHHGDNDSGADNY